MPNLTKFTEAVMSQAKALASTAEFGAFKSVAATKKVAKAAYRARVGVAQKGGKLAFVAMGLPAVAGGFEAWAAAAEAKNAAEAKAGDKVFLWGRVGALAASSIACCVAPWVGWAALAAAGAAAAASLFAAAGNFSDALRERSKGRRLSSRSAATIGAARLAAFSALAATAALSGPLALSAATLVGAETLVSALGRKAQATKRLCKIRNRGERRAAREAAETGALDDAYQCRPEAFGAAPRPRRI